MIVIADTSVVSNLATIGRAGLNLTGILGVLLQAKAQGLIPAVRPCIEDLQGKARFWLHQRVLDECLLNAGELP